jgi:endonuclease/exonuclease/phosphatase family metal-dependent hydrolase
LFVAAGGRYSSGRLENLLLKVSPMNSYLPLRPVSKIRLRDWLVRLLLAILAASVFPSLALAAPPAGGRPLKVMTRNLYQGTDYVEAMTASNPYAGIAETITNVLATQPQARITAIAQEIADNSPDLVALQEATLWKFGNGEAYFMQIDPVALLAAELQRLGEPYVVEFVQPQFTFEAPGFVSTTTQIAILARAETLRDQMQVTDAKGALFGYNLSIPTGSFGDITVNRGWAYVDVTYRGTPLRFVTAHPESFADIVENIQVGELIAGVANPYVAGRAVIMAADFNTNALAPEHSAFRGGYELITENGFIDAWAATESKPALTCCQLNSLTNPVSQLNQEIDFVFVQGYLATSIVPENVRLTGNKLDSLVNGLWPSDHAGLVARVRIGQ